MPDLTNRGRTLAAPPGGLRERRKADRRRRILEAARLLISERGFEQATYDAIADSAGVSRGTVFNYFPYKESMLVALAASELADLTSKVAERREAGTGFTALQELDYLFAELAGYVDERRELVLPLSYELLNPDPARSRAAYVALPLAELLRDALARGREEGSVRADYSAERLARTLANTYFITALQWAAYRSDRSIAAEMRVALTLTLEGLRRRS